jgi:hypothetical protein
VQASLGILRTVVKGLRFPGTDLKFLYSKNILQVEDHNRQTVSSEISSSHGSEYEAQYLLGCTAMFLIECRQTFQKYVLPP